jgi:hypothetical protein
MDLPENNFKHAIRAGRQQIGLVSLANPYGAELVAGSGFDWLVLDGEHSPNAPTTVIAQLQAVAAYPVSAIVRPAWNDKVLIKRYLDIGAQSLLIPYVQNAGEAAEAVAAIRYPTRGVRGVAGVTRASRFGRVADYAKQLGKLCLLVQIETRGPRKPGGDREDRRSRRRLHRACGSRRGAGPPRQPTASRCKRRSRRDQAHPRPRQARRHPRHRRRSTRRYIEQAPPSPPWDWTRWSSPARPKSSPRIPLARFRPAARPSARRSSSNPSRFEVTFAIAPGGNPKSC